MGKIFEQEKEESAHHLENIKSNLHMLNLQKYIEDLRANWKPKTQAEEVEIYHGSKKGDIEKVTYYWDVHRLNWTYKEAAFRGYVFNKIKEFIKS